MGFRHSFSKTLFSDVFTSEASNGLQQSVDEVIEAKLLNSWKCFAWDGQFKHHSITFTSLLSNALIPPEKIYQVHRVL